MRIGELNKNNDGQFLKMINLNGKNMKTPEIKLPDAKRSNGLLPPKGHVNPFEDPFLDITGKDPSEWQKIIPVDDKVAEKIKALIKEDFVKRNGMCGMGAQADAEANIIKSYYRTLPGEKRLAAIYSCQQIGSAEANRFASMIREQNPSWQYGEPFDTSILEADPVNKGLDMKA